MFLFPESIGGLAWSKRSRPEILYDGGKDDGLQVKNVEVQ